MPPLSMQPAAKVQGLPGTSCPSPFGRSILEVRTLGPGHVPGRAGLLAHGSRVAAPGGACMQRARTRLLCSPHPSFPLLPWQGCKDTIDKVGTHSGSTCRTRLGAALHEPAQPSWAQHPRPPPPANPPPLAACCAGRPAHGVAGSVWRPGHKLQVAAFVSSSASSPLWPALPVGSAHMRAPCQHQAAPSHGPSYLRSRCLTSAVLNNMRGKVERHGLDAAITGLDKLRPKVRREASPQHGRMPLALDVPAACCSPLLSAGALPRS